jgi:hypothetical protein
MFKTVYIVSISTLDTVKVIERYSTQSIILDYVRKSAILTLRNVTIEEFKRLMEQYDTDQAMQFRELKIAFIGTRL